MTNTDSQDDQANDKPEICEVCKRPIVPGTEFDNEDEHICVASDKADSPTGEGTSDSSVSYSRPTMSELEDIDKIFDEHYGLDKATGKYGYYIPSLKKALSAYTDRAVTKTIESALKACPTKDHMLRLWLEQYLATTISVRDGGETSSQRGKTMDEIDKAAIKAMVATNYCTKHGLYHGQKYKSCTPQERKMVRISTPAKDNKESEA